MKDLLSNKKKGVYCDNEKLKNCILDAEPHYQDLYPHEVVMIRRAKIGQLKTTNTTFPSIFYYQYYVYYPGLLLKSLIDRGYIKIATLNETLDNLGSLELRALLNYKKLKSKGTSSKSNMRAAILENFTPNEIEEFLSYRLYLPTQKGEIVIENNEDWLTDEYAGWRINCGHREENYILEEEINVICFTHLNLNISVTDFACTINGETIRGWVHRQFPPNSLLNISIDGEQIWENIIVDIIYLLKNKKMLILASKIHEESPPLVKYTGYDMANRNIAFSETSNIGISSNFPVEGFDDFYELHSIEGIIVDGNINYYVSVTNSIGLLVLQECFGNVTRVERIQNLLSDDNSLNYVITIQADNQYLRNIIMYMIIRGFFTPPVIKDIPLHRILELLRASSINHTHRAFCEDALFDREYETNVVNAVRSICKSWREFYEIMIRTFPKRVFRYDMFSTYSSDTTYRKDENFVEVRENESFWNNEFKALIEKLMIAGKITPKWISEFSLFCIAQTYFPDAVFQFRDTWLEKQSLDIFIPSINLGLEYQGEQHYSPLEFFGGQSGLADRQRLDENKRKLCAKNGVRLIEWEFTKEVNNSNFVLTLSNFGFQIPPLFN